MRKPRLHVALLSLLLLALPVLAQGGIILRVQRANAAPTPDLPIAVVAALNVSGSMSGQPFIDARSATLTSISEPVPPPSDPDLRLLLMAVLGVIGLLMSVAIVGMLMCGWAAMYRLDRQAQAILPVWWWLIPFALLVLTAFFVVPHMLPIDVRWNPPADIVADTALGPDQLNATANLSGYFVYEPPPGTVLRSAGQQPLQVTFHGEPLPSPWRGLAIVSGLLTLVSAVALAFRAWWGWYYVDRQPCREDPRGERKVATAPADGNHVERAGERWEGRDERPRRGPRVWWSAVALALVILGLAGLLWYYLVQPRTAVAQQTINVLPGNRLSWDKIADVIYPCVLTEAQLNAVAAVPGEIHYDPGFGEVLDAGGGQPIKATFTPNSSEYGSESLINYINVLKGTPTLTWTDEIEIACGSRLGPDQLNPKAYGPENEVEGEWTYSLGEDTFGQDAGPIPTAGSHKLVASFHPTDFANWNDASISTTLRVPRTTPTLNWPQPAPITYQEGLELGTKQLNALANVPGTYSYTPAAETKLEAGERQLTVIFQPDDSTCYDAVTGSVNLIVLPGDPGLRCSDPANIVDGTALGPDQLNAQADVAGMFTYTPHAGTILPVGDDQPLMVEFEPDDKNYRAASCIMKINVKPGDTWHEAQFLKNGDFEDGFTVVGDATAVGTHWRHFNNGDYHYGYYDDPWDKVWYNANHSQLIEIGSATYDPGDRPNRLSGISQTVSGLIPGQRYTLTLHGIIRVSEGDPNTDNLSYVVQWGVAPGASAAWGDVKTWNIVLPWAHVFPYLSAGPVQSYATTFTAESDTLTLFICLLKKPGDGNTELNLNLDGLSLIGPTTERGLTLASR